MKRKVSIQKGFVYGVTAVAVLAVITGVVMRMSTISADTPAASAQSCLTGSAVGKVELAADEKAVFGQKAVGYDVVRSDSKRFRVFMGVTEISKIGAGGIVDLKFGIRNMNNSTFNEDHQKVRINFAGTNPFEMVYQINGHGGPNLAPGAFWSQTQRQVFSDYNASAKASLGIFHGEYKRWCISNFINIKTVLTPAPTPTPTPSPSKTPTVAPSPSKTPTVAPSVSATPPLDPNLVNGARGCYYTGKKFDTYVGARSENINYIWGAGPALSNGTGDNFSVRWEGFVIPRYTDAYTFKLNYDDGVRLWIGGKQYINDWNTGNARTKETVAITLQAGTAIPIKLEYFENVSQASVQLYWRSKKQVEQIIPGTLYKHNKDYQCAPGTAAATPTPSATVTAMASITSLPLSATLDTSVSQDGKGVAFKGIISSPILTPSVNPKTNYTFWWNCKSTKTTYSTLYAECGAPETVGVSPTTDMKNAGRRFVNLTENSKVVTRNFSSPVTGYTALLLIEREGKTAVAKDVYNFTPAIASKTATITVSKTATIAPPTRTPVPAISVNPVVSIDSKILRDGIKADYYKGQGLLEENLVVSKLEKNLDFNWGNLAPAEGVPVNDFSARFSTKVLAPATGDYSIGIQHNDGVRVWLGGVKVIDQWRDYDIANAKCPTSAKCVTPLPFYKSAAKVRMEAGRYYDLKVEYYDVKGRAQLKFFWQRPSSTVGEIINKSVFYTSYNPNPPYQGGTGLLGSYYAGTNFQTLKMNRIDRQINFDWKTGGPAAQWKDQFSARWIGQVQPRFSEKYTFTVNANDGVRLWIDNKLVVNKWEDTVENVTYTASINMTAGKKYPIKLEMYENTGKSLIFLKWRSASEKRDFIPAQALFPATVPSPTPTVTVSQSASPSPSPSVSASASVSPSPSPSPSPSQTVQPDEVTREFAPGFTAIYVPDAQKPEITSALIDKGLSLFRFGPLEYAWDAERKQYVKTWSTAISTFNHKIGYYVKNPSTSKVSVNLPLDNQPEEADDMMVYKGWNFLANSSASAKKLSELVYEKRICTETTSEVNCAGYSAAVNFGNLTYGWKGQGKAAYTFIYVLNDPVATANSEDPFTVINVANQGIGNVSIPAGKQFWIYFFD